MKKATSATILRPANGSRFNGENQVELKQLLSALAAFQRGDFSVRLPEDWTGLAGKVADSFNNVIAINQRLSRELERIGRVVGKEGRISQRISLGTVSEGWADAIGGINTLIGDLVHPTSEMARVIGAVAKGDLAKKMATETEGRHLQGEFLRTAKTVNTMVDQLGAFASEVTRVAREVGTEGKLGGQARVKGVAGTWKDLTENVNLMAGNLTAQVRNIAAVTTAVANGNLTKKITVDVKGEFLELKDTVNVMVDQLRSFASEVTRVAREVGSEGILGGQARVEGVSGTWKDLTDSVNFMARNLTSQVRNIANVTTAVARGDLSKKITVDVNGEILELKNTINTMVDQLSSFASEVTRVAREVGTEGKLGGQAEVKGVAGTWKDLTENVNLMASNLTAQVRNIAEVTTAIANGSLSRKITVDVKGEILEMKNTINTLVDRLGSFASEVTRVAREVGSEGKLGGQADVRGVSGTWKDLTDSVNFMAGNLTGQVRNIAEVTTAVARGDLSKKITVDVKGEILELKNTINTMVDQLNSFASEVTRVAREVGSEGKLGGQADVKGGSGTWKDLTDSVNFMAGNLTDQVRGIAKVVTGVANGDLKQKLLLEAKGEIAALAYTINSMIVTLATFADQVTTVAREVGVEGKLGGQANVPGAAGTWRDLTDNVNQLAGNLTSQLRAIADVAMAVTKGDLTRSIQVAAQGEVAFVKDNINEMIRNLRDTTSRSKEQDWLKTNLAKFNRMLQGQRDLLAVARMILSKLAPVVSAQQGVFYIMDRNQGEPELKLLASYAYRDRKGVNSRFRLGEGLVGQAALERQRILLTNVPDDYVKISSGLGEAPPRNIVVLPILFEGQVKAVMELSSVEQFNPTHQAFLDQLMESIGIVLNTIEANTRTEDLLKQSQSLAGELQSRQQELQQTNQELEEKARQLVEQNAEVERKKSEVEQARQALEDKARQLSLTSRYKSEFLANMSHELRTPLNSLLILAEQLSSNSEGNLTPKQIEFAGTIRDSGVDLLKLINDILDLSKVESGTVTVDISEVRFREMQQNLERTFGHVAENKGVNFRIEIDKKLPPAIYTDAQRLDQVLKNLLSNAFKFTERGHVKLRVAPASNGWSTDHPLLQSAKTVFAFSVSDSGIGIPKDKQMTIFEAFQQADGSTSRRFGGTGLGLAISRELAHLLGGEIVLESHEGHGSTFTLFLPDACPSTEKATSTTIETAFPERHQSEPVVPLFSNASIVDDRFGLLPSDKTVLIVEEDNELAQRLLELAHEAGLKVIVTPRGRPTSAMVRQFRPIGIVADWQLSDIETGRLLERLKSDLTIRHIPIVALSTPPSAERAALKHGAIAALDKPIGDAAIRAVFAKVARIAATHTKKLLVIEDDAIQRSAIRELVGDGSVEVVEAPSAAEGLAKLRDQEFGCVILDLILPDISGFSLIEQIRAEHQQLPVIIYTGKDLSRKEEEQLNRLAQTIIVKDVRSPERLFDQSAFWLHRDVSRLPKDKRNLLQRLHDPNAILAGKKILIVDDDIRNIFAMTSLLERYKINVTTAETGKAGIEALKKDRGVDLVLMDIMLPEMDGYDTIRAIRQMYGFNELPIVALTAKAMKRDREKCIDAGASDYIAKPVETEELLSLLRNWVLR
jgi:signal transduction histidine kinase/HAMP domain-containing protein/DNA-binding response OmpR family regulator